MVAASLCLYFLDKISSVFVFSTQFLCQLISFCLTGVTGVLFAGLSGSDYQLLKFSSTSTFDFAHINLQPIVAAAPLDATHSRANTSRWSHHPRSLTTPNRLRVHIGPSPDWNQPCVNAAAGDWRRPVCGSKDAQKRSEKRDGETVVAAFAS